MPEQVTPLASQTLFAKPFCCKLWYCGAQLEGLLDCLPVPVLLTVHLIALAGKSFLLNRIIQFLREDYGPDFNASVAVTAATGIAATHISGTTLHSQTGCGIPQTVEDFDRMWKPQSRDRWRQLKVGYIEP